MRYEDLKNTIFDVPVSLFKNCFDTVSIPFILGAWLTDTECLAKQNEIRAVSDKSARDKLKIQLPTITPSALLNHRNKETTEAEKLISYSGFMQIDIDYKDNLDVPNWDKLIEKLSVVKNIAYLGESVSGTGYWGLVPVSEPENLHLHFKAFNQIMLSYCGIKLDTSKGSKITDLRIYSHTPHAHFNLNAETFKLKYEPKPFVPTVTVKGSASFLKCESWVNEKQSFSNGNRNNYLVSLAAKCCKYNVDLTEAITNSYKFIDSDYSERKITDIFKSIYGKYSTNGR